jgi:hypothetical protein
MVLTRTQKTPNIYVYIIHNMKYYLGSTLLRTTHDYQLMKKWIHFVIIKFHLNENIEWHCMHLELEFNSNLIQLNSNILIGIWIELNSNSTKFNSIMGLRFSSYYDQQCELNGQYQKRQFNLTFIISWPKNVVQKFC